MNLRNLNKEDILDALGIEHGNWWGMALAGFGVGCIVGAAVAVLVTPKSGRELRGNIRESGRNLLHRGKEMASRGEDEAPSPTY
jgi:hypothetical protein